MSATWDRVRQLEGTTLHTLTQRRPFTVTRVENDKVTIEPHIGKRCERSMLRDRIEHIADATVPKDMLRKHVQNEYPTTQNSSYIAAIAYEVSRLSEALT